MFHVSIPIPRTALKNSSRTDRKHDTFRPMYIQRGVISSAKGSAYLEMQNTKIICAIYGPKQSTTGNSQIQIICDQQDLPIKEALENCILMEQFAKTLLEIHFYILEDDGSIESTAINCACMALIDAGIPMKDMVTSCTISSNNLVDPTKQEETFSKQKLIICMYPTLQQIASVTQIGNMDIHSYMDAMELGMDGCKHVHAQLLSLLSS